MKKLITALAVSATLALSACGGGGPSTATPAPTVTVTETPAPVTVEVPVTPQACKDALQYADRLLELSSDVIDQAVELSVAQQTFDIEKIEAIGKKVEKINGKITFTRGEYDKKRAICDRS
jgi:predicted small lipoprotein YifL